MNPIELLVYWVSYTIAAFGLAYIVGHSKISLPLRLAVWDVGGPSLRFLVTLVECPACFGFWIGGAFGAGMIFWIDAPIVTPLIVALYTTGSNFLLGRATGLISDPSLD